MQNDRQHYHMPTRNLTVDASLQARSALGQNFTVMARWKTTYNNNFRDKQHHCNEESKIDFLQACE